MKKSVSLIIDKVLTNKTVKEVLLAFSVGKGKIEELRVNKGVFVNDKQVDLNYVVSLNDKIVFVSEETCVDFIKKDIEVLYEDEDFIAVYKEKGMLVHSDGTSTPSLINYVSNIVSDHIIYPVNRIDVDTSGIVLFAKHFLSSTSINKMVENHELEKIYLLKVKGKLAKKEGKLDFNLGRDRHNAKKMIVNEKSSLKAITYYEVLKETNEYSLINAKIITGRKHQIRVSFAHINHPLIGDKLYGDKNQSTPLQLEATYLRFISPITKKEIVIKTKNYLKR